MKRAFSILVLVTLASLDSAMASENLKSEVQSHMVGLHCLPITPGVNRIHLQFDAIKMFPTLADMISLGPTNNFIGDEISFYLDGCRQIYRIVSVGTNGTYKLTTTQRNLPSPITLAGIPSMEWFTIRHNNTNELSLNISGAVPTLTLEKLGYFSKKAKDPKVEILRETEAGNKPIR